MHSTSTLKQLNENAAAAAIMKNYKSKEISPSLDAAFKDHLAKKETKAKESVSK